MTEKLPDGALDRRGFIQLAAAGAGFAGGLQGAVAQRSETVAAVTRQPSPIFGDELNTADIIVETLIAWGATCAFGVVGDGINSVIEALRKRRDRIRYFGVRHEEAAAFMASGFAKHTGQLGVCVGTTGPGAIHLLNGLYDAQLDGAAVVAITGTTFHDLIGVRFQQGVDTTRVMQDVALYNVEVTGPEHAIIVANRACRAALGDRGVAHLTIAKDVQMMKRSADKRSMLNPGARSSSSWMPALCVPPQEQLRAAASVLNAGARIAILAGQGALPARSEVTQVADLLGAPVARSLLGRGGAAGRFAFNDRWDWKSGDRALLLGDEGLRHYSYPRLDHAVGAVLPNAGASPRCAGGSEARPAGAALSRRDRPHGRCQRDAAGTYSAPAA
jgi:pyruvate dehydrogenase (quinone)